ncbi:MAG TPA: AI-2E family transporter [Gemmatimonadales bacterium]|nr:AI-2E family transporter [Gemmatimonadales bacterium]
MITPDAGPGSGIAGRGMRLAALVAPAILLAALLVYMVREVLSPLLVFALLWAALWPERQNRHVARLLAIATALVTLWLFRAAGSLAAPFILGLAFAYVLSPAVSWLRRHRVPRWLGSLLVVLPFLAALVLLLLLLVPAMERQVVQVAGQLPLLFSRLADWLDRLRTSFLASNQALLTAEQVAKLRSLQASDLVAIVQDRWQDIARGAWGGIVGIGKGVRLTAMVVGYVVVTPVVTFHLLNHWDTITAWLAALVPPARREEVLGFVREYDGQLGRFVRGTLTEASLVATLTGVGLALLGFPAPLLMAVSAGLGNLVPWIGVPLSMIPGVVLALASGAIGTSLLQLVVVFGVVTLLDQAVTGPRIIGGAVGLNPVWVMIALAMFGLLLGFVGLLVAVPLAVLVRLFATRGLAHYRASGYYAGNPPGDAT